MLDLFKKAIFGGKTEGVVVDTSKKLSLDKVDIVKIAIHAGLVGAAAAVTVLSEYAMNVDYGTYTALVIPVLSTALAALQKYFKDNDPLNSK